MRVIGGIYGGRRLRAVEGLAVRPTSDRLRETLFNILAPVIEGSSFIDICAGSGAVGIEALSRGANHVTFIDRSRRATAIIEENLRSLGIAEQASILCRDAEAALKQLAADSRRYDLAFFDPPYASEIYPLVLGRLAAGELLSRDAIVVVEYRAKMAPGAEYGRLRVYRELKQGESALAFYSAGE